MGTLCDRYRISLDEQHICVVVATKYPSSLVSFPLPIISCNRSQSYATGTNNVSHILLVKMSHQVTIPVILLVISVVET